MIVEYFTETIIDFSKNKNDFNRALKNSRYCKLGQF